MLVFILPFFLPCLPFFPRLSLAITSFGDDGELVRFRIPFSNLAVDDLLVRNAGRIALQPGPEFLHRTGVELLPNVSAGETCTLDIPWIDLPFKSNVKIAIPSRERPKR